MTNCYVCGEELGKEWLVVGRYVLSLKKWRNKIDGDKPVCGRKCAHALLDSAIDAERFLGERQ